MLTIFSLGKLKIFDRPDSSSSSEYEHQIDYTYDEDYTQISEG